MENTSRQFPSITAEQFLFLSAVIRADTPLRGGQIYDGYLKVFDTNFSSREFSFLVIELITQDLISEELDKNASFFEILYSKDMITEKGFQEWKKTWIFGLNMITFFPVRETLTEFSIKISSPK